jgi:PAS domain S-box-containing protein
MPESLSYRAPPAEPSPRLAQRVRGSKSRALSVWEARTRQALAPAEDQPRPVLRDHLPQFLDRFAEVLESGGPPSEACVRNICRDHGSHRASLPGYTPDRVLHEYQLLRGALIETLEEDQALEAHERDRLLDILDEAAREAVAEYAAQQASALRESEEQSRLLIEGARDYAIIRLDGEGRIRSWNPGAERITGFTEAEIVGTSFARFFTPEDRDAGAPGQELETAARTGRAEDERWHLRKDGSRYWASGVTTALRNERGELQGFGKVMRDLTERKQLEDELEQRAAQLAEADRRKDEFLAVLGHELRNPLSAISNALYILDQVGATDERSARQRATALRQTRHLARLVDDLLDVSRIARGQIQLVRERVDLGAVVTHAVQALRAAVEGRQHKLDLEVPADPVCVEGDPVRLEQVVTNLLTNAARYTPPGGSIRVSLEASNGRAALRVRDNGLGIPPEKLDAIFELFTQLEQPGGRLPAGLGIGLTLVKRLVGLHHGTITARSAGVGEGSEFVVDLPLSG